MKAYYIIVSDITYERLERRVNQRVEEGWKPVGGVSVRWLRLSQAMIRSTSRKSVVPQAEFSVMGGMPSA